jgi:hypothetical protein
MTITEPIVNGNPRRLHNAPPDQGGTEISREALIGRVRQLRTEAYLAGRRVPGRPALAKATGVSPYRIRQALEEIAREHPRFDQHHQPPADQPSAPRNGTPADGPAAPAATSAPPVAPAAIPHTRQSAPGRHNGREDARTPNSCAGQQAPTGASTAPMPRPHRDWAGSVARSAVLVSMFVLAAAVWVKAAALSGHQIDLAVVPVVDWPIRLAYFAPILVEGAVYAAIRICHTLDYARETTRNYARRTAAIGLVAMVLVGATVGLGLADEPYIRDAIGGLIGGLGPYMGWRTSRASAMVAGDRRAATGPHSSAANADAPPPRRWAVLLDTLTTAATTRVATWSHTASSGARTGHGGASLLDHEAEVTQT